MSNVSLHAISSSSADKLRVQDSADAVASVVSPSGRYLVVLREVAAGEGKKRFVELWEGVCLLHIHDVISRHKAFYVDGRYWMTFCSL